MRTSRERTKNVHAAGIVNVNREARPWLFCFGHYPLYCGDPGDGGCKGQEHPYYDGMYAEIESLLFKYNVDFFISGHIHGYER